MQKIAPWKGAACLAEGWGWLVWGLFNVYLSDWAQLWVGSCGDCLFVYLRAVKVLLGVVNVLCLSIRFGWVWVCLVSLFSDWFGRGLSICKIGLNTTVLRWNNVAPPLPICSPPLHQKSLFSKMQSFASHRLREGAHQVALSASGPPTPSPPTKCENKRIPFWGTKPPVAVVWVIKIWPNNWVKNFSTLLIILQWKSSQFWGTPTSTFTDRLRTEVFDGLPSEGFANSLLSPPACLSIRSVCNLCLIVRQCNLPVFPRLEY